MEGPGRPGYVLLRRKPGQNAYEGLVEHSFAMGWSADRVRFDLKEDAEESLALYTKSYPEWEHAIFDVHDEETLPIVIDWDAWRRACAPAKTLSGVANKFGARNPPFKMKG